MNGIELKNHIPGPSAEILKMTNFEVCLHSLQNCENQSN